MPKRLSDITHAFERTTEDLEDAQDALTHATEAARAKVDACAQSHHAAYDDLHRYLKDHQDVVVVAGDYGYRFERFQIARAKIMWAHHVWVEDPAPAPSYRVPPPPTHTCSSCDPSPTLQSLAHAYLEPRAGEAEEEHPSPSHPAPPFAANADGYFFGGGPVANDISTQSRPRRLNENDLSEDEPRAGEAELDAAMDKVRATWDELTID